MELTSGEATPELLRGRFLSNTGRGMLRPETFSDVATTRDSLADSSLTVGSSEAIGKVVVVSGLSMVVVVGLAVLGLSGVFS